MIGEMRNKIILQPLTATTDAAGGQSVSFGSSNITVWAKVENTSGSEGSFGDQIRPVANYTFTIRYIAAITSKYRISYNSKFLIYSTLNQFVKAKKGIKKFKLKKELQLNERAINKSNYY